MVALEQRLDRRISYTCNHLDGVRSCSYASMIINSICDEYHQTNGLPVDISITSLVARVGAGERAAKGAIALLLKLRYLELATNPAWGWPSANMQKLYGEIPIVPQPMLLPSPSYALSIKAKASVKPRHGFIYLMINRRNGYYKIGFSVRPSYREKTLQSEEPEVEMLCFFTGTTADERALHARFADKRVRGEWFALSLKDAAEFNPFA